MKSRAPRCKESVVPTTLLARQLCQSAPALGASASAASDSAGSSSAHAIAASLTMVGDSLRHRLDRIPARVPRHQDEKREIADGENPRRDRAADAYFLQAEIHQRQEGNREHRQEALEDPAAVAHRLDR